MDRLVELKGVGKSFPTTSAGSRLSGLWYALRGRTQPGANRVLDQVDLHVDRGESIGLIGDNGAGKSTLLKVLAGVLTPSEGRVTVNGSLGALLELGAGFHPDFTGRENLRLSATLTGMSADALRQAEPEIIAFADIGDAIDEPIRHYSSGMVVRLGFAMMTATRPDLLITDEVLAVGDESFQRKCLRWTESYLDDGGTLLLVSHSIDAVRRLCRRAYWLDHGRVRECGEAGEVVDHYLAELEDREQRRPEGDPGSGDAGLYRLTRFTIDGDDAACVTLSDSTLRAACEVYSPDDRAPVVAFGIRDWHGTPVYGVTSEFDQVEPTRLEERRFGLGIEIGLERLEPGRYTLSTHALDPEGLRLFDTITREFVIAGDCRDQGFLRTSLRTSTD